MPAAEAFEQIIRHQGVAELVPFLGQLAKSDIVAVRQRVKALDKELNEYYEFKAGHWGSRSTPAQRVMLHLAALKTYSRQEVMGRGRGFALWQPTAEYREAYWAVLAAARPAWLTDWLLLRAELGVWQMQYYALLRELETRQLIAHHPRLFALALPEVVPELGRELSTPDRLPDEALAVVTNHFRQDETLLTRDVWLLFDFDTSVNNADTQVQLTMTPEFARQAQRAGELQPWQRWAELHPPQLVTWLEVLAGLVATGHLDRGEVLTRSLLALRRDFRRPLLAWFKGLFLKLSPTAGELLVRQTELMELLAHPLPLVVNFALDQLKPLWAEADFQVETLLLHAEGLMTRADINATLKTLLTSLGKLLKTSPAHAPAVARLYAAALPHADAAVQERAARGLAALLQAKKPVLDAAEQQHVLAALREATELLAAPARTLLAPWLVAPATEVLTAVYEPQREFVPDLSPATAVVPVADWHELLFLTGQVLKHANALALERWLDGLLRLRPQLPPDYPAALQTYFLQLYPWLKGKTESERPAALHVSMLPSGYRGLVQALLLGWARGFAAPLVGHIKLRTTYHVADPLVAVAQQRLAFAEALLLRKQGLPLLSTPTHAPYWVAPSLLVERVLAYEAAGQEPNPTDLAVALARTAHAHPAEAAAALALLPQVQHPGLRQLLAWLLGPAAARPDVPATQQSFFKQVVKLFGQLLPAAAAPATLAEALPQLWAVAARTKLPAARLPALASLAEANLPGVAQPWQPTWRVVQQSETHIDTWLPNKPEVTETWAELRVTANLTRQPVTPTLLYSLHAAVPHQAGRFGYQNYVDQLAADYPFLVALLPQHPAPLYWHTLRLSADWVPGELMSPLLHSLLVPGPTLDEPATLLLALGLAHETAAGQGLAVEVLLATVAQRRVLPGRLGCALGQLLAGGFVAAQPVAASLAQLRAIDPVMEAVLGELLAALLPELPAAPIRNLRKLLDAYADLVARTRQPVPTAVQARLGEWRGSPSLKKVVQTLVAV